MSAFPSVDLTKCDLAQAAAAARRLTERSAELVGGDVTEAAEVARRLTERTVELVKDATYVAVGLGVLTVNRAQVRRRELERMLRG